MATHPSPSFEFVALEFSYSPCTTAVDENHGSGRPSGMPDVRELVLGRLPFIAPYRFFQGQDRFCACWISDLSALRIGRWEHPVRTGCPIASKPRNIPHCIHQIPHRDTVTLRQLPIALHQLHLFGIQPAYSSPQGKTRKDPQHFGDALYFRHGRCPSLRQRKLQKPHRPNPFSAAPRAN